MKNATRESANPISRLGAGIGRSVGLREDAEATGRYMAQAIGPRDECRDAYLKLRDELTAFVAAGDAIAHARIRAQMTSMEEVKWEDEFSNLVTTVGKNDALDKYLSGSSYTAAWYIGLISSTGYAAGAVAADTAASHSGWTEDTGYSNASRPTAAFASASAGSKALSSALAFNINATVTIKGCFLISNATKSGTTGILYSAGLFSNGDKALSNGDTLNVSYTASL